MMRRCPRVVVGVVLGLLAASGQAQEERAKALPLPAIDEGVQQLLEQPYLTDEERADLRVRHGVWTAEDVSLPEELAQATPAQLARAAEAALLSGDVRHKALLDERTPALLRARGMLLRGEPGDALRVLGDGEEGAGERAQVRLVRARALLDVGKREEARVLLAEAEAELAKGGVSAGGAGEGGSARELAAMVESCVLLSRLQPAPPRGEVASPKVDFQQLLNVLAHARDNVDRLAPEPSIAEVMLLLEKNSFDQASEAMEEAIALAPRNHELWLLAGELAAQGFDFEKAERIASTLDELAAGGDGAVQGSAASLAGTMVRAMVRLRQIEGQQALSELAGISEQFPGQRRVRALRAAAHAVAFDDAAMRAELVELDKLSPGTPDGYLAAGDVLALARQYPEAAAVLAEASKRAPGWASPAVELGLSELQAGNLDGARAALEHAESLDRSNKRATNSLVLLREIAGYTTIENEHFVVRFKPGQDELLAREMLPELERIFERVTGDGLGGIRHVPAGKTTIELYPNHRWFSTRITGLPALHTFAAATGPVIAMEAPRSGPGHLVGPYDWPRVVQHEYVHTVTLSRTRNRLPHWFTEASAVMLEDRPMDWNTVQMLTSVVQRGALFDFDTINIKFVRPKKPIERAQAYAQGAWMYAFMIEHFGETSVLELMDLYAKGTREEEAFGKVLRVSRAEFLQQFEEFATKQLQQWGMIEGPGVPSIDTLLESEAGKPGEGSPAEPTSALVEKWLEASPKHPLVLDLAVKFAMQSPKRTKQGEAEASDIELLERHARARPMDPTAHRLLAQLYLNESKAEDLAAVGRGPVNAIPHLQFLDLREQHSTAYAAELARLFARVADEREAEVDKRRAWEDALASARRATQLSPYDATIRELAATIALRAGELAIAQQHIEALVLLEPTREVHKQRLEAVKGARR